MNRAEFETSLRQEGYEVGEDEIEPNRHRGFHAHPVDARIFVLDGSITLVVGTERVTYHPGDSFSLPAGTKHEEHTEADGMRYVIGRRAPVAAAAAKEATL
jgi:quercetin dioxygenase-like cupin family protein